MEDTLKTLELLLQSKTGRLTDSLVEFFHKHPRIWNKVWTQVNDDTKIQHQTIQFTKELHNQLNDPWRGIRLILDLNIPKERYKHITHTNEHMHDNQWIPITINNVKLPPLFPSYESVDELWYLLLQQAQIVRVRNVQYDGSYWNINNALSWYKYLLKCNCNMIV